MLTYKQTDTSTSKHTCFHPHTPVVPHPFLLFLLDFFFFFFGELSTLAQKEKREKKPFVSGGAEKGNNGIVAFNALLVRMSISRNDGIS